VNEFRERLLSQSVISRRSGDRVLLDTKHVKKIRDENGHDTTFRGDDAKDVTINVQAPLRGKFRTELQ
jgi:hypothetical protein